MKKLTRQQRIRWTIILAMAVLGSSIWVWDEVIKDRVIPKRWGVVEQGEIYRSGQLSSALVEKTLAQNGIEVVVSLTGDKPNDPDHLAEQAASKKLGIDLLRFPLGGNGTGDIDHYVEAIAAMEQAKRDGKPVLVHCAAGTQRTGGVVACYQLLVEGKPRDVVLAGLKRYGWREDDNPALLPFINEHMAYLAQRLKTLGGIDHIPDPLPVL